MFLSSKSVYRGVSINVMPARKFRGQECVGVEYRACVGAEVVPSVIRQNSAEVISLAKQKIDTMKIEEAVSKSVSFTYRGYTIEPAVVETVMGKRGFFRVLLAGNLSGITAVTVEDAEFAIDARITREQFEAAQENSKRIQSEIDAAWASRVVA